MKRLLLFRPVSWGVLAVTTLSYHSANGIGSIPADTQTFQAMGRSASSIYKIAAPDRVSNEARGGFNVKRGDYNVHATSALHGTIRVRDKLKFTFDIVARQI